MTRIVSLFFAGIAIILAVYWVVPGANPPEMTAVKSVTAPTSVRVVEPVRPTIQPSPQVAAVPAVTPTVNSLPPAVIAAPPTTVARSQSLCDSDPIRCLLEGGHPTDPADVTGTIARQPKAALHPVPKPAGKAH